MKYILIWVRFLLKKYSSRYSIKQILLNCIAKWNDLIYINYTLKIHWKFCHTWNIWSQDLIRLCQQIWDHICLWGLNGTSWVFMGKRKYLREEQKNLPPALLHSTLCLLFPWPILVLWGQQMKASPDTGFKSMVLCGQH